MKDANRDVLDRGSLPEMLAERARRSSDRRLVIDAAMGLIASASIAVLRPPLWIPLAALAFSLGAFGAWGILDREALDAGRAGTRARTLAWARGLVGALGGVSLVLFGVSLFFSLLGPWIS